MSLALRKLPLLCAPLRAISVGLRAWDRRCIPGGLRRFVFTELCILPVKIGHNMKIRLEHGGLRRFAHASVFCCSP